MTVSAHFDGKVIVPDEPLDLRPNQTLRTQIEPVDAEMEESALAWIASNAVDSDALPTLRHRSSFFSSDGRERRPRANSPQESLYLFQSPSMALAISTAVGCRRSRPLV